MSLHVTTPFKGHVEVLTWGTHHDGGNGLLKQAKTEMFGGNAGHAALRIIVPVNDENKELIEKHCRKVPYATKRLPTGEEVFEIYISAWPGDLQRINLSEQDLSKDNIYARRANHFSWDPKWLQNLKLMPEKRRHKGQLGSKEMTYGPHTTIHRRNLSEEQIARLDKVEKFKEYSRELDAFNLLLPKLIFLEEKGKKAKLSKTDQLLLDRFIKDWRDNLNPASKLTVNEISNLINKVEQAYLEFVDNNKNVLNVMEAEVTEKLKGILTQIDIDKKKYGKITPKLQKDIDDALKYFGLNFDWQGLDPANAIQFSPEKIERFSQIFLHKINDRQTNKHYEPPYKIEWLDIDVDENYLTMGTPPDAVITLPIRGKPKDQQSEEGLIAKMLIEADRIASSQMRFDVDFKVVNLIRALSSANCSKVVSWVLKAGAEGTSNQKIFKKEALGFIGTPQVVYNNAVIYQEVLYRPPSKKLSTKKQPGMVESPPIASKAPDSSSNIIEVKNNDPHQALAEFREILDKWCQLAP